jgi:hypothetical protein
VDVPSFSYDGIRDIRVPMLHGKAGVMALKAGIEAPGLSLPDQDGKMHELSG